MYYTGVDPGFFLGGGALVSCSTSTPINHIVFFLQNTSCIRKPQVISGGGGAHPLHPPPRSAPVYFTLKAIQTSEYVESETTKKDNIMAYLVLQGTINFMGIFEFFFFLNKMKPIILLIFFGTIKTLHYVGVPSRGLRLFSKEHVFKGSKIDQKYYQYYTINY